MSARDTFLVQSRQRPSTDQPTEVCGISLFVQVRLVRFPGERAAAIYCLIGTAKLNGVDPEAYLSRILDPVSEIRETPTRAAERKVVNPARSTGLIASINPFTG